MTRKLRRLYQAAAGAVSGHADRGFPRYEAIKPFLVSIPLPDGDSWIYDVDATPKVGATIPDTPETPPDTPENAPRHP